METLELLYVSIWKKIQHATKSNTKDEALNNKKKFLSDIKCDIMHDLFDMIEKDDLETMVGVKDAHKREDIWAHLVQNRVVNRHGKIQKIDQETKEKLMYTPDMGLNEKLVCYINGILTNRHRCIKVPNNLIPFVERHLDTTLNNAWRAAFEKKNINITWCVLTVLIQKQKQLRNKNRIRSKSSSSTRIQVRIKARHNGTEPCTSSCS